MNPVYLRVHDRLHAPFRRFLRVRNFRSKRFFTKKALNSSDRFSFTTLIQTIMLTFAFPRRFGRTRVIRPQKTPKRILICLIFSTFLSSCFHPHIPTFVNCNFNLSNIFPDCHNPTSSFNPISYSVVLTVKYLKTDPSTSNPVWVEFSQAKVNSATPPSKAITITSHIPKEYQWYVDITLIGDQCARCAPSTGNGRDCTPIPDGSSAWYAGIPQRTYTSPEQSTTPATFSVSRWTPMANVSCGCVVNN